MITTIISGASRGIGKAIADDLAKLNHKLILLDSKIVDLEDYKEVYQKMIMLYNHDMAEEVNVILCGAIVGMPRTTNLEEIERIFKINVLGNLAIINSIVDATPFPKKVRIVWFAGGGAAYPFPEFFGYSLSKVAVVRAVENLAKILPEFYEDVSIIALSPGAVQTDMLRTVLDAGCEIGTRTDISEAVDYVRKFITDEYDSLKLNGMFLHVRNDPDEIPDKKNIYKLRRIE